MAVLIVPPIERDEARRWPSLGDQVAEWIEAHAVWGPGSRFGQRVTVDDEFYAWLVRSYQVFPYGHPRAGRRRFGKCVDEKAKGTGKTERAILVAQAEAHPTGPVRCVDWRKDRGRWVPVGGPVPYPRLIFVAYTEEQVQRTGFGRFREALKRSPLAGDYHITQDRVVLLGDGGAAAGEVYPLAISPDAADGDLPTWMHVDEPHRWTSPRHHETFRVVEENTYKDQAADAWLQVTSTAGHSGEDSVEERLLAQAELVVAGELDDPTLFFHRRFAPEDLPMETPAEVEAAVRAARGPAASWSGDIPRIVARWFEPKVDRSYYRRVWLNQWRTGGEAAFDVDEWGRNVRPGVSVPAGALVVAGFDGSIRRDSTALVVTEVASGLQIVAGFWSRPPDADDEFEIDRAEVDAAVETLFDRWDCWRLYADPFRWGPWLDSWAGTYGAERVVRWDTTKVRRMAWAVRGHAEAVRVGDLVHDGDERLAAHIANARRRFVEVYADDERNDKLHVLAKDRKGSDRHIDAAVASVLSWEARRDAQRSGASATPKRSRALLTWS